MLELLLVWEIGSGMTDVVALVDNDGNLNEAIISAKDWRLSFLASVDRCVDPPICAFFMGIDGSSVRMLAIIQS